MAAPGPKFLWNGPEESRLTVALAHGAGAAMDAAFMAAFAQGLADHGLRVARFEFPYMRARRADGGLRPPDRAPVLIACWHEVIAALGDPSRLVIGGKSMGGRIASLIADEAEVAGLVCLGHPFHPPGRPEKTRTAHLAALTTPTLIVQGERDALGNAADLAGYSLSPAIRLHWCADGDHGFKPRKVSGHTEAGNWTTAIAAITEFIAGL